MSQKDDVLAALRGAVTALECLELPGYMTGPGGDFDLIGSMNSVISDVSDGYINLRASCDEVAQRNVTAVAEAEGVAEAQRNVTAESGRIEQTGAGRVQK